ncbi:MAG: phosphotransferase family protein [Propionibacteriaceae bacterium]
MTGVLDGFLAARSEDLQLARHGIAGPFETVLLTPRFVTSRHLIALVYAPGAADPAVVAKIPRQPGDDAGIRREAELLRVVQELTPGGLPGVPELLGTADLDGHLVLVESALRGSPWDPAAVAADQAAAVAAGLEFVERLPITQESRPDWYDDQVRRPLAALLRLVGGEAEIADRCERTHEALRPLAEQSLPAVLEHGDLSHPNLLRGPAGELRVLDWERATAAGVPGHDLTFFLQYVAESVARAFSRPEQGQVFDTVFAPDGWATAVLQDHLTGRGVDPQLASLLVLTAFARSTTTLVDRLELQIRTADGPVGAVLAAVRDDRDFWLWGRALARQTLTR